MNKKGFTLIELLAVLSVLAIILLVAVPSINNQLKQIKNNNYKQFQSDLFLAADAYISASANDYEILKQNNGEMCIEIQTLIEDGWIKSNIVDPKLNKKIGDFEGHVTVKNINNTLKYAYDPNLEKKSCSRVNDYTSGNS